MKIGEAIRKQRLELGWTQRVLAEKVGVSAPFLSEIEGGRKTPSYSTLVALAEALGCDAGDILGGRVGEAQPEAASPPPALRGASWWGCVVDEARAVAQRGDPMEVALARDMLAYAAAALGEAPATPGRLSERRDVAGERSA